MEEWRKIKGISNYSFSSFGRIRNDKTDYYFSLKTGIAGYLRATVIDDEGNPCQRLVHRFIAEAFLDYDKNLDVDHIDRNRKNNNINNLQIVDRKTNCKNKKHSCNKSRAIIQLTMNGDFVARYERIKDAPFRRSNIVSACAGRIKSVGGFLWEYANETIPGEIWRDVVVNNCNIKVSNFGRVQLISGKITYGFTNCGGYQIVNIKGKPLLVHRLVCESFNGLPKINEVVDHIDRNRKNNHISNLRWVSQTINRLNCSRKNVIVRKCPVESTDSTGITQLFPSMDEAMGITGIRKSNICMCCKGQRKTAGGKKWRYVN